MNLTHKGTITIETDRLVLRRFKEEDALLMFKNWAADPKVTRFLSWKPHEDIEVTKEKVNEWIEGYKNDSTYNWIIELKELGEPVGAIAAVKINEKINSCEIGYCIGSKFWNKGITTEALKAVIDFMISEVGINRVEALHDTNNIASGKVMKKAGMKFEGDLREAGIRNEGFYNLAIYSFLVSDLHNS